MAIATLGVSTLAVDTLEFVPAPSSGTVTVGALTGTVSVTTAGVSGPGLVKIVGGG